MNTKRQTIWLVSMLSLMVVLSAYYLFTEDVNKLNTATDKVAQDDIKVTTEETDPPAGDQAVSNELDSKADGADQDAGAAVAQSGESGVSDAQVLEQLQAGAQSGADYLAELALKQNQELGEKSTDLMDVITDPQKSVQEVAQASDEYEKIQTMQAKVDSLEEQLSQNYKNAIVYEENNKYRAIVQVSAKLDAKAAQSIIDLMIKELGVSKDSVSVQYLQ